jgi:hypothetical protein
MHETASKFLFDQTSQGNMKFDDPLSFSPFNTRFPPHSFDIFTKFISNNLEENSLFNKSVHSIRTPQNFLIEKKLRLPSNESTPVNKDLLNEPKPQIIITPEPEPEDPKKKKKKKV